MGVKLEPNFHGCTKRYLVQPCTVTILLWCNLFVQCTSSGCDAVDRRRSRVKPFGFTLWWCCQQEPLQGERQKRFIDFSVRGGPCIHNDDSRCLSVKGLWIAACRLAT